MFEYNQRVQCVRTFPTLKIVKGDKGHIASRSVDVPEAYHVMFDGKLGSTLLHFSHLAPAEAVETTLLDKVWAYCTRGSSDARKRALRELIERGLLAGNPEAIINDYLSTDRGFCDDGIRRFREAVGVPEPVKEETVFTYVVEFKPSNTRPMLGVVGENLVKAANVHPTRKFAGKFSLVSSSKETRKVKS